MNLSKQDKAFVLNKITYVDYKHIEPDRILLMLAPRLKFDGTLGKVRIGDRLHTIKDFRDQLLDPEFKQRFQGFSNYPEIVYKWLETELVDLVNRGKPNQTVVALRPLHGNAYKFRNTKHARDYDASKQLFWMLDHARRDQAQYAKDELKKFVFAGLDLLTDQVNHSETIDVETQAILSFIQITPVKDKQDTSEKNERFAPLCIGQADLLADDILRLLTYQDHMPRSVLVDYLKTLLSFHLGIYHLRLIKLLSALVKRQGSDPTCQQCPMLPSADLPHGDCPHRIGLVLDIGDPNNPHMTELASRSATTHYQRTGSYIHAHFITKKLDEMASYQNSIGRLSPAGSEFTVGEILQLLQDNHAQAREQYFGTRLQKLIENPDQTTTLPSEVEQIISLKLNNFEAYIEIIVNLRGKHHREFIIKCLDSLFQKNSDSGLIRQRGRGSRSFTLGSRLLEVLLQLAVLEQSGSRFMTREIRVDELLQFLRERYGLYIDRLPTGDGFSEPSINDQQALRNNLMAFKNRLREIGFFQDLSDAYITQTISPRYTITAETVAR